ncbi:hypothetical protein MK338_02515, partial [Streptococcus vestibularis]|nr:hypothetical protein [Streptococcus vestibularis]
AGIYFTAFY